MGLYINHTITGTPLPARGKVAALLQDGATIYGGSLKEANLTTLVCVVNNGPFDAAVWACTPREVHDFSNPDDPRPKVWLVYPHAAQVAR